MVIFGPSAAGRRIEAAGVRGGGIEACFCISMFRCACIHPPDKGAARLLFPFREEWVSFPFPFVVGHSSQPQTPALNDLKCSPNSNGAVRSINLANR